MDPTLANSSSPKSDRRAANVRAVVGSRWGAWVWGTGALYVCGKAGLLTVGSVGRSVVRAWVCSGYAVWQGLGQELRSSSVCARVCVLVCGEVGWMNVWTARGMAGGERLRGECGKEKEGSRADRQAGSSGVVFGSVGRLFLIVVRGVFRGWVGVWSGLEPGFKEEMTLW